MNVSDVKQGDPIVYEINGASYNGVALGKTSLGHHPGLATTSYHLNLVYLNEQGQPIKIFGAPLLTKAESDGDSDAIAEFEANTKPDIVNGRRVVNVPATKQRLAETINRTIGWRPSVEGETQRALKDSLTQSQAQVLALTAQIKEAAGAKDTAEKAFGEAQTEIAGLKAHVEQLQGHVGELAAANAPEVEALKSQVAELTAELEAAKTPPADPGAGPGGA